MNTGKRFSKMWILAILLVAFVAGCGSDNNAAVTPAASSAKAMTAFVLNGSTGVIDETAKTIDVNLPFGTSKVGLIATFNTTGVSVKVGTTVQESGVGPANDFTNTVIYTVIAADGTSVNYAVTVTVGLATSKSITAYSIAGQVSSSIVGSAITVTVPYGTTVTALTASFSTSGTFVSIGATTQVSGTTANNFTGPVTYTVHAADASTATYIVTVKFAPNSAKLITAYTITGQNSSSIVGTAITVTMPFSTPSVTNLVATFTASPDAVVTVGGVTQASGTTANDFTLPVDYLVTAASGTTATYTVTVNKEAAGLAPVDLLTAGDYVIFASTAITGPSISNRVTGDVGIYAGFASSITGFTLVPDASLDFATAIEVVSPGKIYARDYDGVGGVGSNGLTPAKVTQAQLDVITAYGDATGRPAGTGTFLDPGTGGSLGGLDLPPGVYTFVSNVNVTIPTSVTLTGSATDVWIFQIPGTLTVDNNVLLGGTAMAKNIFWAVGGAVTINSPAQMEGVILSGTAITLNVGASANSRLLAQSAVTMAGTVTQPAP